MQRIIVATMAFLVGLPAISSAQTYRYAYYNTMFGQAYQYRYYNGPFSYQVQGFRPNPNLPYLANPYLGFPYGTFNPGYYPFLGAPAYAFPAFQPQPIVINSPIIVQPPMAPPVNNIVVNNFGGGQPAARGNGNNPFAGVNFNNNPFNGGGGMNNPFAGNQPNLLLPPRNNNNNAALPPDVKQPPAKKVEVPKVGPAPKEPAKIAEAPKVELPKVPQPGNADLAQTAMKSGEEAFANGEYGRARELFRKVTELQPNSATGWFMLSQAQFAIGKYQEAVNDIARGIAVKADWSSGKFNPRSMYQQEAVFDDHLKLLRDAVAQYPDDATLNFLLGHQLWFDNQRDAAKPFLAKAKAAGPKASPIDIFMLP